MASVHGGMYKGLVPMSLPFYGMSKSDFSFGAEQGTHPFGIQAACPSTGGTVHPFRMWLTVYEIGGEVKNAR